VVALSYKTSYAGDVAVLNFRTDERSEKALAELMSDGSTTSEAIRQALVDAVRLRRREQMRAESRELMNDAVDREESRRVLAEMDELRAW
jgi:predicted phage gp36 major capsid-like protein